MKPIFNIILLLSLLFPFSLLAQDNRGKELTFIYISHQNDTPIEKLCIALKNAFDDARNYDLPTIFYFANYNHPIYASVSVDGLSNDFDAFNQIIYELQSKKYHEVDPLADISNIIDIFNKGDFVDKNGQLKYDRLVWKFYINQNFWDLYNEKVISRLGFILDIDSLPDEAFHMVLIDYGVRDLEYDINLPFGDKNLCEKVCVFDLIKLI